MTTFTTGGKPREGLTKDEQISNLIATCSIIEQENIKLREQVERHNVSKTLLEQKWNEYRRQTNNEDAWSFKEWLVKQF